MSLNENVKFFKGLTQEDMLMVSYFRLLAERTDALIDVFSKVDDDIVEDGDNKAIHNLFLDGIDQERLDEIVKRIDEADEMFNDNRDEYIVRYNAILEIVDSWKDAIFEAFNLGDGSPFPTWLKVQEMFPLNKEEIN